MTFLTPLLDVLTRPGVLILLAGGYLAGSIPFGLLLAKRVARTDVRTEGSGNIGATNVARVVGKKLGALTLLLDALKAALPVLSVPFVCAMLWAGVFLPADAQSTGPEPIRLVQACVGLAAFLGHCFPVWLRFRGGKGVASGVGFLLAFAPAAAAFGIVVFAAGYALFRMVSLGSLLGAVTVMIAMCFLYPLDLTLLPVAMMFVLLILRHTSNIRRMWSKAELKV